MRIILLFILLLVNSSIFAADNFFTQLFGTSTYDEEKIPTDIFPQHQKANNRNVFVFDPNRHVWAVYNKSGDLVGTGRGSGGRDFCKDINKECRTVVGKFTVFRREGNACTSNTFPIDEGGGAPMPHCMFFHEGYAIHGSNNVPDDNVSHGCIRVAKEAARWMNNNYIKEGATVVVLPYENTQT